MVKLAALAVMVIIGILIGFLFGIVATLPRPAIVGEKHETAVVVTTTPPVGCILTTITHYTSSKDETDNAPCIAADGSDICKLRAAGENTCASRDLPLNTRLYAEGHGYCVVHDRLNARYKGTGRIDWYMGTDKAAAFRAGIQNNVKVCVLSSSTRN